MTQRRGTSVDKTASRAREAEEKAGRSKNRGKAITDAGKGEQKAKEETVSSDDDDMGGCEFSGLSASLLFDVVLTFLLQMASSTPAC